MAKKTLYTMVEVHRMSESFYGSIEVYVEGGDSYSFKTNQPTLGKLKTRLHDFLKANGLKYANVEVVDPGIPGAQVRQRFD